MKTIFPIANIIALIITVVVNYLSNTGIFNGNTMSTISDRYANYFTPAGYAFSIWGLIYITLFGFVIYTGRSLFTKRDTDLILFRIGWVFVFTCMANAAWVVAWLNDMTGVSVLIMIALLLGLLRILRITQEDWDYRPLPGYLFVRLPFALYTGWISVALIANAAAWLTKTGWEGGDVSTATWAVIMIVVAGLINIAMVISRHLLAYGLVGIWALLAIAVANNNPTGSTTVVYACYIVAAVILIAILFRAIRKVSPERESPVIVPPSSTD